MASVAMSCKICLPDGLAKYLLDIFAFGPYGEFQKERYSPHNAFQVRTTLLLS